uniref:Contractile injection system tube protein N-terminal domain-containing protein n=1 Tax=Candidatus Kentrum sp. LPFa TaxID=2126335 RepID=A0A450VV98_9GAMM|nr:MAG: hypothetical protein BECKLPF1236B_GA0070989_100417 [Candidatus Kentron sp. LPFa]
MALGNLFKLEKLKISAYPNEARMGPLNRNDTISVMFNPASFSTKHCNFFNKQPVMNGSAGLVKYSRSASDKLTLDLVIDGAGVGDMGVMRVLGGKIEKLGKTKSVAEQIDEFLDLCFRMDGEIHEPKFLKIQWGEGELKDFDCRLESVDITYTSFERNGAPLRAELSTVFVEDVDASRKPEKSSPDLSHARVIKSGDTLPLLCNEIYGSMAHYPRVAEINNLDDFRNLIPGHRIIFPPLEK